MDSAQLTYPLSPEIQSPPIHETVGLFQDADMLQKAVVELDTHFPRHAISILGDKKGIEEKFGQSTVSPAMAEATNTPPLQAPVRSEEKVIGVSALIGGSAYVGAMALALAAGAVTIPVTIFAAAVGAASGAAIGGVLAKVLGDHYHQDIEDQIQKGGLLLWVNTINEEQERIATDIMNNFGATHVKVITRI